MVTGTLPSKLVPSKPVPIVNGLVVAAVIVVESPREMVVPLMVMELLVRLALSMLVNVFVDPLIVLFVSVCEPSKVTPVESISIVTGAEPL